MTKKKANKPYNPHRIDAAAMAEAIHTIDDKKEKAERVTSIDDKATTVYTILGKHDYQDENRYPILDSVYDKRGDILTLAEDLPEAYAKSAYIRNTRKYYVKIDNRGMMYNPYDLYEEERQTRSIIGLKKWRFHETNPKCFRIYLDFLRTKNKARLIQAEREM